MKIKKRFVLIALFAIFFVFNSFSVYAALGLGPAKREVNFAPNYEFSVDYILVGVPSNQKLEVYAKGDLSEYVEFDKINLTGEDRFKATVKLPLNAEKPGPNELFIGVREVVEKGAGIGARLAVEALITINVPYPGQYAEISLLLRNVNAGEPIPFVVKVNNLGKEDILASANIEIYSGEEKIETLNLGNKYIKTQTKENFAKELETGDYKPGPYKAVATVYYGKTAETEGEFRIGTLLVDIINWTSEFEKGKINKFDIEIESLWNSKIDDIYAEVRITDDGEIIDSFKTPSLSLKPWKKAVLKGYFNTEKVNSGPYKAEIKLFYEGETTEKIVDIRVVVSGLLASIKNNIIIIIVLAAILIVIIVVYFFWRKHGKKGRGKKQEKAGKK
jgi:hypothetical protein